MTFIHIKPEQVPFVIPTGDALILLDHTAILILSQLTTDWDDPKLGDIKQLAQFFSSLTTKTNKEKEKDAI